MLIALGRGIFEERNQHFAEALSTAINDWQVERWVDQDRRLVAAIIVPQEDAEFAAAEIERRAHDTRFRQVLLSPKAQEPLGRKRYWPIYAAAERAGLPVAFHPAAMGGGHPSAGAGWPTYYLEEHNTFGTIMQGVLTSMIFEGVFERFPESEGGFGGGRLHLGAIAELADGQALVSDACGGAAYVEAAVGISPPSTYGSPPSRWKRRVSRRNCAT